MSDPRRTLPSVDAALSDPGLVALLERHPRGHVVDAVRDVLADRRERRAPLGDLTGDVARRLRPSLRRVINATGVILHTNLGRAPLAAAAVDAACGSAAYGTLEWDVATGERGSRHDHVVSHLRALTGAQDACVANTNAGAVLLALVATASGREVIVSRGQLVEIGGGFRVPEVLEASGCRLVEVGTTNKTRIGDYAAAITDATAAILRVHPSNYRVVGFTEEAQLPQLVALCRDRGLVMIDDLGSGAIDGDAAFFGEPGAAAAVAAGVDLACFSGDKLLGGPQAGIVVGTREAVARCKAHPLMRALRPDKLTLAALEATLALHRDPVARRSIPVIAMLTATPEELRARAEALATALGGREVVETAGRVGGGSLPLTEIASAAVVLPSPEGPDRTAARLRDLDPSVVIRIADDRALLDVLTLSTADLTALPALLEGLA